MRGRLGCLQPLVARRVATRCRCTHFRVRHAHESQLIGTRCANQLLTRGGGRVRRRSWGVIHRDLKPANVMLTTLGDDDTATDAPVARLIDWGESEDLLAREETPGSALTSDLTKDVGTWRWMSPAVMSLPNQASAPVIRTNATGTTSSSCGACLTATARAPKGCREFDTRTRKPTGRVRLGSFTCSLRRCMWPQIRRAHFPALFLASAHPTARRAQGVDSPL
jgi:serine/threonine protein kinase